MSGSEQFEELETECYHCGEPVDIESTDIFKSVSDQFWHRDCFAEHCYERRSLVATPEGSFKIKSVAIKEIEDGQDKVLDSFWRADCPVCYHTHESEERTEEARSEFVDEVLACCDLEWLPPADWIEDCDVCGTDHREQHGCKPIVNREPFPHFSNHRFDCAECEWSGEGEDLEPPRGKCPDCGTTAVRAVEVATDGGVDETGVDQIPDALMKDNLAVRCMIPDVDSDLCDGWVESFDISDSEVKTDGHGRLYFPDNVRTTCPEFGDRVLEINGVEVSFHV